MKIQRFNDWTDEKLKEVIQNSKYFMKKNDSDQIKNMNYLIRVIKRYLLWIDYDNDFNITDFFFFKNKFIIECEFDDYNTYDDDDVNYTQNHSGNSFQIDDIDYDEMLQFLNDPELFENTKKYNL